MAANVRPGAVDNKGDIEPAAVVSGIRNWVTGALYGVPGAKSLNPSFWKILATKNDRNGRKRSCS